MIDRTDPTNRDTVPAMLTPGEFVLNKEASNMFAPVIEQMNNAGLQQRAMENNAMVANMGGGVPPQNYNLGGEAGSTQGIKSLLNFIGSGEGGYEASNRGTVDKKIVGSTNNTVYKGKKLSEMTINEILEAQALTGDDRLFAVGKYQMIPSTFKEVVEGMGLSGDTVFSPDFQDQAGMYLATQKRPILGAYLNGQDWNGKAVDEDTALMELAKEWASAPLPYDVQIGGTLRKAGDSRYGSGNKAQHSIQEARDAIRSAKIGMTGEYPDNPQNYGEYSPDRFLREAQTINNPGSTPPQIMDNNLRVDNSISGVIPEVITSTFLPEQQNVPKLRAAPPQPQSFGEAFAAGRSAHGGGGGMFDYNGQKYSTNIAEEDQMATANNGGLIQELNWGDWVKSLKDLVSGPQGFGQANEKQFKGYSTEQIDRDHTDTFYPLSAAPGDQGSVIGDNQYMDMVPPNGDPNQGYANYSVQNFLDEANGINNPAETIQGYTIPGLTTPDQSGSFNAIPESTSTQMVNNLGMNAPVPPEIDMVPDLGSDEDLLQSSSDSSKREFKTKQLRYGVPKPGQGLGLETFGQGNVFTNGAERYEIPRDPRTDADGYGQTGKVPEIAEPTLLAFGGSGENIPSVPNINPIGDTRELGGSSGYGQIGTAVSPDGYEIITDSLGSVQAVNPRRIDPEKMATITQRFADGKITEEQYQGQKKEFENAILQDNAHKAFLAEQQAEATTAEIQNNIAESSILDDRIAEAERNNDTALADALRKKQEALVTEKPVVTNEPVVSEVTTTVANLEKQPSELTPAQIAAAELAANNAAKTQSTEEVTPEVKGAMSILKDVFGDIFDKKELIRAAVMYLGGRATGLNGNQALAFAGKNYIARTDAKTGTYQKVALEGKHTKKSLAIFKKSMDFGDLIAKGLPAVPTGAQPMTMYDRKTGREITLTQKKVGDGNYWFDGDRQVDVRTLTNDGRFAPKTPANATYKKTIRGNVQSLVTSLDGLNPSKNPDAKAGVSELGIAKETIGREAVTFAIENGMELEQMEELVEKAYKEALVDARSGKKPSRLSDYFSRAWVESNTTDAQNFFLPGETKDGKPIPVPVANVTTFLQTIKSAAAASGKEELANMSDTQVSSWLMSTNSYKAWQTMDPDLKEEYIKTGAVSSQSGMMEYILSGMVAQ